MNEHIFTRPGAQQIHVISEWPNLLAGNRGSLTKTMHRRSAWTETMNSLTFTAGIKFLRFCEIKATSEEIAEAQSAQTDQLTFVVGPAIVLSEVVH